MRFFIFTADEKIWYKKTPEGGVDPFFTKPVKEEFVELVDAETGVMLAAGHHVAGAEGIRLRMLFDLVPPEIFRLAERASELLFWRVTDRFCGVCGTPLTRDGTEHAMKCPTCGSLFFPRINPAVITLVTKGDKVLLERKAQNPLPFWSLVAGFVEAGETLEEAAAREIREETGVSVKNLRYQGSQPWPFPNSLMAGFRAEYDAGEIKPDGVEIERAEWFAKDDLPAELPSGISIARRLLDDWRAEKKADGKK